MVVSVKPKKGPWPRSAGLEDISDDLKFPSLAKGGVALSFCAGKSENRLGVFRQIIPNPGFKLARGTTDRQSTGPCQIQQMCFMHDGAAEAEVDPKDWKSVVVMSSPGLVPLLDTNSA